MEVNVKNGLASGLFKTSYFPTAARYARINIKCDENASKRLLKIGGFANLLIFLTVLSLLLETY